MLINKGRKMNIDFENPFSDYGSIVGRERFIGRNECLRVIENRTLRPSEPGNLAIIGEPRIGKSSLVNQAILVRKNDYLKKKIIPIWINLATFQHSSSFFRALVTSSYDELEELNLITESIDNASKKAFSDSATWIEGYGKIQRYFQKIRDQDIRILFVLDEFDHARLLFKNDITGFQGLRELSYRPDWRINYITTSRRTIREIEEHSQAISTFDGIFQKHYLGMFDQNDLISYFSRIKSIGIPLSGKDEKTIYEYCGGYPYILDMVCYEIVEKFRITNKLDIFQSVKQAETSLFDQYDRMMNLMKEDNSLNKLLQILIGPVIDIKQIDVDHFMKYGLLRSIESSDNYQAFSKHFQDYLRLIERQVILWPIWQKTELALRHIITTKMISKYGSQWINVLEKSKPNLETIFENCRRAQAKEQRLFGSRASQNLIDFTYPDDLFTIIFAEWKDVFSLIFLKDKNYWSQRSQLLTKVRNPLAHCRDSILAEYERQLADGYCKEIIAVLENS